MSPTSPSPASGKKTVFTLFALALTMGLVIFLVGLREKHKRLDGSGYPLAPPDTAVLDPNMRAFLDSLPGEWTRISSIEGQGWVIYSPCNSEPGVLHIVNDSSGHVSLQCEFCDSLDEARILKVLRFAGGDRLDLDLGSLGKASTERVDDAVALRFLGAPVKGYVLTWRPSAADSMIFVPTSGAREFETLKAEDESPEGCGEKNP